MSKKNKKEKSNRKSKGKYTKEIFDILLQNPKKALNHKQIASILNISNKIEREVLLNNLNQLVADKKILEIGRGKFRVVLDENYVVGTMDLTSSGAGYLMSDDLDDDIYVPKGKLHGVFQGDLVKIKVRINKRRNRPEGKVVEILQRFRTLFTGVFEIHSTGKYGFVVTDHRLVPVDFYIPKSKFNEAETGQMVVVKLNDWPDDSDSPFGEIVEILGKPEETQAEMHAILLEYGLPSYFPEDVLREAEDLEIGINKNEIYKRRDFRDINTFTIDPPDAKDFDDALSVRELKNGHWEIGIHIADVTHYVQPGTLIDSEAYNRGTSVYLVDRVVPMLPEALSNGVCSLRPNEEKLTFSAVFEMNDKAKVIKQWFGRTVIRSNKKYSYDEAQNVIDGAKDEFSKEMLKLNELAQILRQKRMDDGAITFDKDEVKFELDENDNPVGTYMNVMKASNHLIEEFMLLCNRKVSEFVSVKPDGKTSKNTFIYRVHDDPDPDKLEDLKLFIRQFGYKLDLRNRITITQSMNELLKEVKGKPEQHLIETLCIRTMSKAIYSIENNVGHYGLAFKYYSHFTAPIRRYPDLMAHRLLQHYLEGKKSPPANAYEKKCLHCSDRERLAVDAERDSIKFMQVKYMEQFIGEEFYGFITGVQEYGIFVEIPDTKCEGMVRLRDMNEDSFYFDHKNYSIVGRKTGIIHQLGDKVLIKVLRADLMNKQLDFELLG